MDFRQVFRSVFDKLSNALRVIDVGLEVLYEAETKQVTVSTTLLRINSFCQYDDKVKKVTLQISSGGPVVFNSAQEVTAGASEGSKTAQTSDIITITGKRDLERFTAILATSGGTATVAASAFRRG